MHIALAAVSYLLAGAFFAHMVENYNRRRLNQTEWYLALFFWLPVSVIATVLTIAERIELWLKR